MEGADKDIKTLDNRISQTTALYTADAQKALDEYEAETTKQAKTAGDNAVAGVKLGAEYTAAEIARKTGSISQRYVVDKVTNDGDNVADALRKEVREHKKMKGKSAAEIIKEAAKAQEEEEGKSGGAATT